MVRFHTGVAFLGDCPSVEVEGEGEIVGGFGGDEEASEVVILAGVGVGLVLEASRFKGNDCLIGLLGFERGLELNFGGLCRVFGGDEEVI
jgi:hypothetical protein